jgi:aryl-alcohol dehydrogenase-like predicted oxidoreductase
MKLALGTVQFGMDYGIANQSGQPNLAEVKRIVSLAREKAISVLDTAIAYGSSEAVLGEIGVKEFRVVTKLPPLPKDQSEVAQWVHNQIASSLERLKQQKLFAVLLHRPRDLLGPKGAQLAEALRTLKSSGVIEKIGVSIYSPEELAEVYEKVQINLVQAPVNVIDRRMQLSGWLDRLEDDGVEVHARSVFLQGLLLMERSEIPQKFMRWSNLWDQWQERLKDKSVSALAACLSYPLSLAQVNQVIVGVDSVAQFSEIIQVSQSLDDVLDTSFMQSSDLDLINPSNWNAL